MTSIKKKWIFFCKVLVILILLFTGEATVLATSLLDLQKEKSELDARKKELNDSIQEKKVQINTNSNEIDRLMIQLKTLTNEMAELNEQIGPLEDAIFDRILEIEALYNEIVELEYFMAEREVVLRERVRAMQVNDGPVRYIDVLIGSKSFSDFIDRYSAVTTLLEADQKILKQHGADQEQLENMREELDAGLEKYRSDKADLEDKMSSVESMKKEKDTLIVALENQQKSLVEEKNTLQASYEETYQMSKDVEEAIHREQQRIYNIERRNSTFYCQSNGQLDSQKFLSGFKSAGEFTNHGQLFLDIANEYDVDPVLMAAIAFQETGGGKSNAVRAYNNPGGLMDPSTDWSTLLAFNSLNEGLHAMGKTLNRLIYKEGKVNIEDLGNAYAPPGAKNDPLGLNEFWVPNVNRYVTKFGGLTKNCENTSQGHYGSAHGSWIVPSTGRLTSHFGWRIHPISGKEKQHRGMDIANSIGTPILAAGDGIVSRAEWLGSYGNMVMITHVVDGQLFTTVYAHLSNIEVIPGQTVSKGEPIGSMGSTGDSTGSHLHFEFHEGYYSVNGPSAVNPLRYINF